MSRSPRARRSFRARSTSRLSFPPALVALERRMLLAGPAPLTDLEAHERLDEGQKIFSQLDLALVARPEAASLVAPLPITILARPLNHVSRIEIQAQGREALAQATRTISLPGPWSPGQLVREELAIPVAPGDGELEVVVRTFDNAGQPVESRRLTLAAEIDTDGRVWTSLGGPTELAFQRLEAELAAGEITEDEARARSRALTNKLVATTGDLVSSEPSQDFMITGSDPEPSISVQSLGSFTIKGTARWMDSGGALNPIPRAEVLIYDLNVNGVVLVATGTTDDSGFYSISFVHEDEPNQGNPDFFVSVRSVSTFALVKANSSLADAYELFTPVTTEVAPGSTITRDISADDNTSNITTAFSVHAALVYVGRYLSTILPTIPSRIDTIYPIPGGVSYFDSPLKTLNIIKDDRWDWDVTAHEYGHYLNSVSGFGTSPGGQHFFNANLSETNGSKSVGLPLAFSEGWASFFGVSALRSIGASVVSDPTVGDLSYDDTLDQSVNYNLEQLGGFGEDNELAVMGALWDLWDSQQDGQDVTSISDKELFELIKTNAVSNIGGVWNALMARFGNIQDQVKIASIFKRQLIAPEPLSPADNAHISPDANLSFSWGPNGGGPLFRNNLFNLRFFDVNWNEVYRVEGLTANSYTLSPIDKLTLSNYGQGLYWAVEGKNTAAPVSPSANSYYLSPARSFVFNLTPEIPPVAFVIDTTVSMNEEAKAIGNIMATIAGQYLLLPADQRPMMNLVAFTDEVRPGFPTNDVAKIVEILNSFDSGQGGGPCPENAIGGIGAGVAWLKPGSKLYIATDASVNGDLDMDEAIAAAISAGIEVHVILDGDCEGLDAPLTGGPSGQSFLAFAGGDLADDDRRCNSHGESGEILAPIPGGMLVPTSTKPPGDQPPGGSIDDPGQPAPDDHGDTIETATRLPRGGERVRGFTTGADNDTDLFRVRLVAGKQNRIFFRTESGNIQRIFLLAPDGTSVLFGRNEAEYDIDYRPEETGDYFFRVEYSDSQAASEYYTVRLAGDGLYDASRSGVAFFSQLAAETGGMFTLPTNTGAQLDHKTALRENVGRTMLGVPVVWADMQFTLPIGQDTGIILHGHDTNWAEGRTTLEFLEGDIEVKALTVLGPDRILAVLNPLPGARQKMRDVRIVTILGDSAEVALGSKVVTVVNPAFPTTNPRNYAVTPEVLRPGQTQRLQVWGNFRGVSASLPIVFGPDITVLSKTLVSESMIELEVAVAPDADTGYRRLTVEGFVAPINRVSLDRAVYITRQADVPRITEISPNLIARTDVREVELKVANFTLDPATATADFGPGITVESFTVVDGSTARASVRIAPNAQLGRRRVDIRSGERTGTLIEGFTVDAGNVPQIDSILPISADQGQTLSVTLRVSGLTLAPDATATFGPDITVEQFDVIDPATAVARVRVAPGASLGGRDVTISSGGVTTQVRGAFQVDAAPPAFGVHEVISVSPASAAPGTTVDVTIRGAFTRFAQGDSTLELFPTTAGFTVESFTVIDPLTAVARITVASNVSPRVGNGSISTASPPWEPPQVVRFPFQIAEATAPRIDSVSPKLGLRGQDITVRVEVANIDLTGTTPGSYSFQGLGVSVLDVNVLSPNVADLSVRILPTAVLPSQMSNALRTFRITIGSSSYNYSNAFSVLDDPLIRPNIVSVSPAAAKPGDTATILVDVGTMTLAAGASAVFGPGVAVESFELVDSDTARVQVRVAPDAPLGPRDLRVTSGNASATRITAFNVISAVQAAPPPVAPTPVIGSISPSSATQGQSRLNVTIEVADLPLIAGNTSVDFGPFIRVLNVDVINAFTLMATIDVDFLALTGPRSVTVRSGALSATRPDGLVVNRFISQTPILRGISPSAGAIGQSISVDILGEASNFTAGATSVDFGPGVIVNSVEVVSPTLARATVTVVGGAAEGARNVIVTTGNQALSLANAFQVTATPTDLVAPQIVDVERYGYHARPTRVVVRFSEPLDPARIGNPDLYRLIDAGRDGMVGTADDRALAIRSIVVDPSAQAVTLLPTRRLPIHRADTLLITSGASGLRDVAGNPLEGTRLAAFGEQTITRRFDARALRIPTPQGWQPLPRYRTTPLAATTSADTPTTPPLLPPRGPRALLRRRS